MIRIYKGNALTVLQHDIGTFDAVITDPPYASGSTLSGKQSSTGKNIPVPNEAALSPTSVEMVWISGHGRT